MDKIVEVTRMGELYLQSGVQKISGYNGECIDYIKDNLISSDDSYIDRSDAASIYQLCGCNINGFKMNQYGTFGRVVYELYNISLDELNKRFIKLSDYLKDALFIGREFRRTQPARRSSIYNVGNNFLLNAFHGIHFGSHIKKKYFVIEDCSFMEIDSYSKIIVLYAKDNIFLAKYSGSFGEEYMIIDCSYTYDGNYEFYGEVHEEYRDRDKVYNEVLKQVSSWSRKTGNAKKRVRKQ